MATNAVEIAPSPMKLDTLAAAYAETGNFDDAIRTQVKIIKELSEKGAPKEVIEKLENRLKMYQENQPWREEVQATKVHKTEKIDQGDAEAQ